MEGITRITMRTYYLFVPESSHNPSILFIRTCTAPDKEVALTKFQHIMDKLSEGNMFLREELAEWTKVEDKLTEEDNALIKQIGILPDIT